MEKYDLFVDGQVRESTGDERIEVEYPYDGTVWASVPAGTEADVDAAVDAARRAFETGWRDTRPSERRELLLAIADAIEDHTAELGEFETRQNGKLLAEMEGQMESLNDWYRYYATLCEEMGEGLEAYYQTKSVWIDHAGEVNDPFTMDVD